MADHVLVGVDGSTGSSNALRWAAWFAVATQRKLHLANAWQYGEKHDWLLALDPNSDVATLEADVAVGLRRLAARELGDPAVVAECHALRGPIADSLLKEAQRTDAALIVVGARGHAGVLRALRGSVSRQLVDAPSRAVAVVPCHEPPSGAGPDGRPFLVGVDGSPGAARAVRWAAESARRAGGEVVAVHAYQSPDPEAVRSEQDLFVGEQRQRLEEEWCAPLLRREIGHRTIVELGDARAVLLAAANAERPACVVVGSRGLGPVAGRVRGSVTLYLARASEWPFVVMPPVTVVNGPA